MRVLQIVQTAYRATIEEQDDTVIWLTHAMKDRDGNLDLLLRGNAVNYGVRGQSTSGLTFGQWRQTKPPRLADDIASLIGKGVDVYYVRDDALARGINESTLVDGLKPIARNRIAELLGNYDRVWHW